MSATDLTHATDAQFRARIAPIEVAPDAEEGFRERAAQELFVARGYDRRFWAAHDLLPHTEGIRRDCRYLIDRVFDAVLAGPALDAALRPNTAAPEVQR